MIPTRVFRYLVLLFVVSAVIASAQEVSFRVLAFHSTTVEYDHVQFGEQALRFFSALAKKDHFQFDATTRWDDLNPETLKKYQVVLWLNDSPQSEAQRVAFEQYMKQGGAWFGFHAAGYNDESTNWPWFVEFFGGAVFYGNNWPPLPAKLIVDNPGRFVAKGIPSNFVSPANEWYIWKPSPRENKDVKVLLTLDPANYPLGFKDTLAGGDLPVAWSNTKYRMIYVNMGHGDKIFTSPIQNRLFENSILWLGGKK